MNSFNRLAAVVLMLCCAGLAQAAPAQEVASLNMRDVDIRTLVDAVAEVTGKNFLLDPRVKGQVTLVSAKPMATDELYEVFQAVLQVHGFATVPAGDVIKIVPDSSARQSALPFEHATIGGDQLITKVIAVQHVTATELVPVLRPLIPQQGHLAAYPPSNVLIISDRSANIGRLEQIIRRIDRADNSAIEVIRLQNASANEVVRVLNSLLNAGPKVKQQPGKGMMVTADERTNSVFISGDKSDRLRLRGLIAHLDTPLEQEGNTQVIFLKYAKAKDMAALLQSMLAPASSGSKKDAASAAPQLVQADEYNNALIISASPDVVRELKAVVRQLDIRRAQILVEAVIAEVSTDLSQQLGVQFAIGDPDGESPVAATNLGTGSNSLASIATSISEGTFSIGPGGFFGVADLDGSGVQWGVLVTALAGDAATNILSTPTLLATDNQEAEIVVGQNVPFVTGSFTTTGDTGSVNNPFQTIERQDVGITLKVKPQVNEGSSIQLEIEQEVSSLAASSVATADVVTKKRAIKTTVTVEDGQIIVLGGLIEDSYTDSQQKVPVLGDMPVLGGLFRYDTSSKIKQNLMVFLRPIIVSDPALANTYSNQKYSLLRNRQLETGSHGRGLAVGKEAQLPDKLESMFDRPKQSLPPQDNPPERKPVQTPPPAPAPAASDTADIGPGLLDY